MKITKYTMPTHFKYRKNKFIRLTYHLDINHMARKITILSNDDTEIFSATNCTVDAVNSHTVIYDTKTKSELFRLIKPIDNIDIDFNRVRINYNCPEGFYLLAYHA